MEYILINVVFQKHYRIRNIIIIITCMLKQLLNMFEQTNKNHQIVILHIEHLFEKRPQTLNVFPNTIILFACSFTNTLIFCIKNV